MIWRRAFTIGLCGLLGTPAFARIIPDVAHEQVSHRQCGPEVGRVCPEGQCCSSGGWCGNGEQFCKAPICQLEFGPSCDGNVKPHGPETKDVLRRKVGSVPYGTGIYKCTTPGVIALTFDDGPWLYTEHLLDLLKKYDVHATFFVAGRNLYKGAINDNSTMWPKLIQRMDHEGHQIGSHTWSHQKLTELSPEQFQQQINFNEIALADILGYFPTYMRPPHSMSDNRTDLWLADLGYHITYFDLNTLGYENDTPQDIQKSKDLWDQHVHSLDPRVDNVLAIEHDPLENTVYNLTEYMLNSMVENGWKGVTVGDCLNDPRDNWYRSVPK